MKIKYKKEIPIQERHHQTLVKGFDFCFDCWKNSSNCLCNIEVVINVEETYLAA